MKNIFIIPFLITVQSIIAQTTPEFQYTLYVQDARGNKDSVMLGYDRTEERLTLNAAYGEVDIKNRPLDSILEIRATEASNRYNIKFHSKKIITLFEGDCEGYAFSSNITLIIRAKYYPITFSWNSSLFNDPCRSKSILVSSENYYATDPTLRRSSDTVFGTAYQRNTSTKLEKFNKFLLSGAINQYFHYYFTAPINNGRNDTIWTYATAFRAQYNDTIVSNKEVFIKELRTYPNPCFESLLFELPQYETGQVAIYDLAGRQIRTHKIAAIDRVQIDVHGLNTGMYFLKFTTVGGKVYVSKFIKS